MLRRRNCIFNDDLQKEFKFITLDKLCSDGTKVVCQYCNVHFTVARGGGSDVNMYVARKITVLKRLWL
jgi:hypothetical protein